MIMSVQPNLASIDFLEADLGKKGVFTMIAKINKRSWRQNRFEED